MARCRNFQVEKDNTKIMTAMETQFIIFYPFKSAKNYKSRIVYHALILTSLFSQEASHSKAHHIYVAP